MNKRNRTSFHPWGRKTAKRSERGRARLRLELLEPRQLLAGDLGDRWVWFESFDEIPRIAPSELASVATGPSERYGPSDLVAGEWIVQLTDDAIAELHTMESINDLLDRKPVDFSLIAGLGSPGLVLLRGQGVTSIDIEQTLSAAELVKSFSANSLIEGQALPNDDDFSAQLLPGLEQVGVTGAWDTAQGSPSVVIGVVDSGIDVTHPDLFLNIWLNQGEIPPSLRDQLNDVDGDGIITFYDLNNLRVTEAGLVVASTGVMATEQELTTQTPLDLGANADLVEDKNENGRIDALDLLDDLNWADGRDNDGNGFSDDLFGVNFRRGRTDPFPSNRPLDELGHGTHVSGTLGAIGNNDFGVVGVNWHTSLMSLRILDNNNQSDAAAAISAINYAKEMRSELTIGGDGRVERGANVRVLNNSWGQPGGFETVFSDAIGKAGDEGILFVAAAGNGNILGNGVNNDSTPFYPASYEADNVIAVAALSSSGERLAAFSNFGAKSVDIAAPGTGVRSTLPGGAFGSANGTSMATPHVAGTAALIWSALPGASVDEVKQAILDSADPTTTGLPLATGGRLNANRAIDADVFAPSAILVAKEDITTAGGSSTEFTVEYHHRDGINVDTIGDDDLVVTRQWGPADTIAVRLKPDSVNSDAETATATYIMEAPGSGVFQGPSVAFNQLEPATFQSSAAVAIDEANPGSIASPILLENIPQGAPDFFQVSVDIEHTFVSDLTATLVAPDGSRAILFSGIGGNGHDFAGTTFDDTAQTPVTQGPPDAIPPYVGTFRPVQSILPLANAGLNGTWTLEIDDAFAGDGGQLVEWSMTVPVLASASSQVLVQDVSETIADFTVSVDIEHPAAENLQATLIDPNGNRALLFAGVGGSDGDLIGTTFSDDAATSITEGSPPLNGTFRPLENLASLGASGPNGVWTLEIEDDLNVGTLLGWSLDFKGSWDQLDFGDYVVSTVAGGVANSSGSNLVAAREAGSFHVQIDDPSVLYVDTLDDFSGEGSLRDAIIAANASAQATTIILDEGTHTIGIPSEADPESTFPNPVASLFCGAAVHETGWSNETTGDFDITGAVTIVGSRNDVTLIDAQHLDRVFKVHPDASLSLSRVAVSGGSSPPDQGGGGILSAGQLRLDDVVVRDNEALGTSLTTPARGGGLAIWGGTADIQASWITNNQSDFGGGVFYCGTAGGSISRSTLSSNAGGGVHSNSDRDITILNSTLSDNRGGRGAIFNGKKDGLDILYDQLFSDDHSSLSADGRYIAFQSASEDVVFGDTNGQQDIFVVDRETNSVERVSVASDGTQANSFSSFPTLSADGRFVAFESFADNLVPDDNNSTGDIFVYDRETDSIERVSISNDGVEGNGASFDRPSISGDGRLVAFKSNADNLVADDTNGAQDLFVFDRFDHTVQRVNVASDGSEASRSSVSEAPALSADGNFVVYVSDAANLVPDDTNFRNDVFVYELATGSVERVSLSSEGVEGNDDSGGGFSFSSFDSFLSRVSISDEGRFVAFASGAENLVADDTNSEIDIFVYDRDSDSIERVNVAENGNQASDISDSPVISGNGQFVAFESFARNLVPGVGNFAAEIYVYDRLAETLERASLGDDGSESNNNSEFPLISRDGQVVAFQSVASNLVAGDKTNRDFFGNWDIFVRDRAAQRTTAATFTPTISTLDVIQSTIADTSDARFSVRGQVSLNDVLLADEILVDPTRISVNNSFGSFLAGTNLIDPLSRIGNAPPIHPLRLGNPAINAGDARFAGSIDQLGIARVVPDIGASETVFARINGSVFVDADEEQFRDSDEPGVPGIEIRVTPRDGAAPSRSILSSSDDPQTIAINEAGQFQLDNLLGGEYQFEVIVPANFSLSTAQTRVPTSDSSSRKTSWSVDNRLFAFDSEASNLVDGDMNRVADTFVLDRRTDSIVRASVSSEGTESNAGLAIDRTSSMISGNGRFVAFASDASNLVPGDTNFVRDIFVHDLELGTTERVNLSNEGTQADSIVSFQPFTFSTSDSPSISGNGRFVAFTSDAVNLVPNDANVTSDIFVFDREMRTIERVSLSSDESEANAASRFPSISEDGNVVAFISEADNLVPDDTNSAADIFVHDRRTGTTERISVSNDGIEGDASSGVSPTSISRSAFISISSNGDFVAFASNAGNLVDDDTNGEASSFFGRDVFVFNRRDHSIQRVNLPSDGSEANGNSDFPSLSADARFVTFESSATNLIPGDMNGTTDVFVFDRRSETIARVSVNDDGAEANGRSTFSSISPDGRFIAFQSVANNLTPGDRNNQGDLFLFANPLIEPGATLDVRAGETIVDINFGLVPDPGEISGRIFEDTITNATFDEGEPPLSGWTVFLDNNGNTLLDNNELSVTTDSMGGYVFAEIPAARNHSVRVVAPPGFEQVLPGQTEDFAASVFLPAGDQIGDRDFGFRRVIGTGQSRNSSVSGRVFDDVNGNLSFDVGIDQPVSGTVVFLDQQNSGVRDPDEPGVLTDSDGNYTIDNLGSSIVAVSTLLDQTIDLTSPRGSSFELSKFPINQDRQPFGVPQSVAAADLNDDSFPDVAVAFSEANRISIRLNDGQGGFLPDELDIDLSPDGNGPTSLVVGQFNGLGTPLDIAVTSNYSSNVIVLTDFNGNGFDSRAIVPVGQEPLEIVSAAIAGDEHHLDLVVVNKADNSIQVLQNDGSGAFSPLSPLASGGNSPVSIVAGQFGGDENVDLAVAHSMPSNSETPFGDVRILRGDGTGNFSVSPERYEVELTPVDLVAANFDNDPEGLADLAVVNVGSNSISILTRNVDDTFSIQPQTLGRATGAVDISAADIDNDGDVDIVASNLSDRNISVFRNAASTPGVTNFAPLEGIGQGQFGIAERMPLALANFDGDRSATDGNGTIDIVTVALSELVIDTLHLFTNTLVDGSHRIELTGVNQVSGLDFALTPAILPPSIAPVPNPSPILEDASTQTITLTGITKGRDDGPPLEIVATSSDPSLIPNPIVDHTDGNSSAILRLAPLDDANGAAVITVTVTDAGADQDLASDTDNGVAVVSFTVNVLASNDPPTFEFSENVVTAPTNRPHTITGFVTGISPGGGDDEAAQTLGPFDVTTISDIFSDGPAIDGQGNLTFTLKPEATGAAQVQVSLSDGGGQENGGVDTAVRSFTIAVERPRLVLQGAGETILVEDLEDFQSIDIRGFGANTLVLDADKIRSTFSNATLEVVADSDDTVVFDNGWRFLGAFLGDGQLVRRFTQGGFGQDSAILDLVGPNDFTNPIDVFDVSGEDGVTSFDALLVVNELSRRVVSDGQTSRLIDPSSLDPNAFVFRFYDVSRDQRITSIDALQVINELARRTNSGFALEAEAVTSTGRTDQISSSRTTVQDQRIIDRRPSTRPIGGTFDPADSLNSASAARSETATQNDNVLTSLSPALVDAVLKTLETETGSNLD